MSKPTRWALVFVLFAIAIGSVLAACATGAAKDSDGMQDPQDAAVTAKMDSTTTPPADAPVQMPDSSVLVDAFVPPDAPPGSLFCSTNAECTVAGQCCLTFGAPMGFCAPGTVILGGCVPIS